ncbi:MAG TPA: RHS repeat-associated core domain-containing protein [Streptosporangiaceae bacterium]
MAAVLPLVTAMMLPPSPASKQPAPARLRPMPAAKAVPVFAVKPNRVHVPVLQPWHRPAVTWPAMGTATATLAGSSAGSVRAGSLPVWAGPEVADQHSAAASGKAASPAGAQRAPAAVSVTMRGRQLAARAGISGVIFRVARAGATHTAAGLHVSLDYRSFADADAGDFASRLRLVELPACVLTTPQVARCRVQTPVNSANDVATTTLGANVTLPAASPAVVLAATTAPSGSSGAYSATPLAEAGSWAEGGSEGAFTYSYPITVPPVPGGLAPEVSLDYNSQSVDGLTSSTNNQASWIGDGWGYQPGFIERDYQTCSANTSLPTSEQTGDLCWSASNTTTLELNGMDTTLVDDPTNGWHAEADNGERIQYQTGTTNGTNDGGYWVVTDPDGTSYYFGRNELPGYASGDTQTNSAWTVPVYATASGQPCYSSTFSSSHCEQAWRWNLDYVTDSNGDAMADFYNTETNYYGADKGTTGTASYIQAGALSKIEYGLRAGSVYGVTPAAEVTFTAATDRTDVPTGSSGDLACSSGASCEVQSPTFWGKYRLTTIATSTLDGSSLKAVDSWALAQDYPNPNDSTTTPSLWLESITRTGEDGTAVTLPPVKFSGKPMANRVETTADLNDGYSIITRMRLTSITSETGGATTVAYDTPPSACTSGNFPVPDANTTLCYPDYWTPPGVGSPVEDWFNKYVVTSVTQQNTVGGGVPVQTQYTYSGAAWHYDDSPLIKSSQRTWDQWRGFRSVVTETGTAPDPVTETKNIYFQGMDGDYQSGGGSSSVSLTSTEGGETVTDFSQFTGMTFQSITYDGAGGAEVNDTVTAPWTSAATAKQSQPSPLPSLQAFMTGTAVSKTFTPLALGGTREADVTDTHDSYGRVTSESSVPDTADPAEDTCTTTSYAANTSSWLLDLTAEVTVVSVPCGTTATLPADAVSDKRTYYDGSTTLGAEPSAGNVTMTQLATSYSGSTPQFTTESTATYDEYGRVLTSTDADNRKTTTAYTPTTGAEPTSVLVTDPMGLATATTYDPTRDLPMTVTNPAGYVTSETYDALGRLTAVWKPGHTQGSAPADETFSYSVSATAPSVITTNTINDTGGYLPAETLYDSLGRAVETQAETPDGGRKITDTVYNSDGSKQLVSNAYYATGAPSGTIVDAPDDQVPSQTGYVYDGAGRVVRQIAYSLATETWETDTAYGGDYTTVSYQAVSNNVNKLPQGGTPTTTFTNGEGETSAIYQYHAGVTVSPADPSSDYDQTTYGYTPAGQLGQITDPAGNRWMYGFNLAGDQTSATDPDVGSTSSTYDAVGQLLSTTDARGKTTSYVYDADGRKVAEYDTTGGAAETGSDELAAWTYDTIKKGEFSSSTSYVGGTSGSAYTEGVLGYDTYELPTGTYTTIPSSAGALAGTYKQTDSYNAYGDELSSYFDYAAGGLPAETVNLGYDTANEPVSLGSSLWSYVSALSYTELGQPQEYAFGTTNEPVWQLNSYDQETGALHTSEVQTGVSPVTVNATTYSYDAVGDVLQESDTPADGPAQVQCFQYDYLGRLSQAWSQGGAGCSSGPSQPAEAGAAAPYWESYGYNDENDLTSQVTTPPTGAATTTSYSYPAAGSTQPHAVTTQQVAAPAGTTATAYGYNAAGDTTSVTTSSYSQALSWNDAGQLSSVQTAGGSNAGTTSYVYDANGNLLMQSDPGSVTLYLPDEQLALDTSTNTVSGTRYYTLGTSTVAARTSAGDVQYLISDNQGTSTLAVDYATLAVSRRYYDPYGNAVGAAASWPGTRGFVGGTADPATGYTNLGAREYNPADGAFLSPDSVITPYKPQDLNAYAYAADSPATLSDPTGQDPIASQIVSYLATHPTSANKAALASVDSLGGGSVASPNYGPCSANITYCMYSSYRANGGQVDSNGIPSGRGYVPPSSSGYCPSTACVPDIITGDLIPAPPPVVKRTVRAVTATQRPPPTCTTTGRAYVLGGEGACTPPKIPSGPSFSWGHLWSNVTGFVSRNKVAIGIGLGALAVLTGGAGLIVVGAVEGGLAAGTVLGGVAAVSGLGAAALDGGDCADHPGINGPCLAMSLGAIGSLMAIPDLGVGMGLIAEPAFQETTGLALGGFVLGAVATEIDLGKALYDQVQGH